jgi:phosphomannomutase
MAETSINLIPSFLNYVPVSLEFGTSGLRGLVADITDLEAYINIKGALSYLSSSGDIHSRSTVVVAGDLRPSTDRIMGACARAIVDSGCRVENAGKIPTPALVSHAIANRCAGVMVTGSHIPFDRNGIKLSKSAGEVLKSDEAAIIRAVQRVRAEEYSRSAAASSFDGFGMFKQAADLPPLDGAAEDAYVRRYLQSFHARWPLRYANSGLSALGGGARSIAAYLGELGAIVVTAGRSELSFPSIPRILPKSSWTDWKPLAVSAETTDGPLDAIVSTDGDSDRPLVAAVLPAASVRSGGRRVRFLPGDLLGIVVAEYLSADGAAVPISANDAVERRMSERKVLLEKTKIGSPYVISALDELRG